MADTRLTNPVIVAANNDIAPANVNRTPSNGSDGKYTWACVGQKDTGSTSVITFAVTCQASSPQVAPGTTNYLFATCQAKAVTTNYVQVTASFVAPSNSKNWTVYIGGVGSGSYVRFVRGSGGGAVRRPKTKAKAKKATAKKSAKKATKKAAAKPARKSAKPARKAAKPARKAAKPARKAAKPARKARRK